MPMAPAPPPCPSLHELEGACDYCGEVCDSTQDELNAISCTFESCPACIYHQRCIEAFLKSFRLDKQRKTGFQCPRGNGKSSKFDRPCPGRVTKSHPIHARNDNSKKRRKSRLPDPPAVPANPTVPRKGASIGKVETNKIAPQVKTCNSSESKKGIISTPLKRGSSSGVSAVSSKASVLKAKCPGSVASLGPDSSTLSSQSGNNLDVAGDKKNAWGTRPSLVKCEMKVAKDPVPVAASVFDETLKSTIDRKKQKEASRGLETDNKRASNYHLAEKSILCEEIHEMPLNCWGLSSPLLKLKASPLPLNPTSTNLLTSSSSIVDPDTSNEGHKILKTTLGMGTSNKKVEESLPSFRKKKEGKASHGAKKLESAVNIQIQSQVDDTTAPVSAGVDHVLPSLLLMNSAALTTTALFSNIEDTCPSQCHIDGLQQELKTCYGPSQVVTSPSTSFLNHCSIFSAPEPISHGTSEASVAFQSSPDDGKNADICSGSLSEYSISSFGFGDSGSETFPSSPSSQNSGIAHQVLIPEAGDKLLANGFDALMPSFSLSPKEVLPKMRGVQRWWTTECIMAIHERKVGVFARQLMQLGFKPAVAKAAVRVHGNDLSACLNCCLSEDLNLFYDGKCLSGGCRHVSQTSQLNPCLDLSLELEMMSEVVMSGLIPQELLETAIVLNEGDIDAAMTHFLTGSNMAAVPSPGSIFHHSPHFSHHSPSGEIADGLSHLAASVVSSVLCDDDILGSPGPSAATMAKEKACCLKPAPFVSPAFPASLSEAAFSHDVLDEISLFEEIRRLQDVTDETLEKQTRCTPFLSAELLSTLI